MRSQFTDFKQLLEGRNKSILILISSIFKLSWEMEAKFDINFALF